MCPVKRHTLKIRRPVKIFHWPWTCEKKHGKAKHTATLSSLPCARRWAHDKHSGTVRNGSGRFVCHVPAVWHTAKEARPPFIFLCRVLKKTHGNCTDLPFVFFVCRVHIIKHTAKFSKNFLILASQLFLLCAYNTCCSLVNFGICIYSFTIFNDLICLIKFLAIKLEVFWVVEYNEPKNDIQVQEVNVRTYAWKPK